MFNDPPGTRKGKVYLVGAGPGDPDLLTVKAVRALERADIVLHDALVSAEVLAMASPRAQVVNVGKRCGTKSISQDEINRLLVEFAFSGAAVVRLKSGDPLIFGRAGEELEVLRSAGIEVEVIPGVTAALAAAASVHVSLTDRRTAEQLLVVSAHRGHGKPSSEWTRLVTERTTVVVYMPGELAGVANDFRRAGLSPSTPCVIISKISSTDERSHRTTIGDLADAPVLPSPCVLIVGEAARTATTRDFPQLAGISIPLESSFAQASD